MNLKFYTSVEKGLKLKARKFLGLILTFAEVTGEKLVGGGPLCSPILNRAKTSRPTHFRNFFEINYLKYLFSHFFVVPKKVSCGLHKTFFSTTKRCEYKNLSQDFFSKCDKIFIFLQTHLLKKSLMEDFIFCAFFVQQTHLGHCQGSMIYNG